MNNYKIQHMLIIPMARREHAILNAKIIYPFENKFSGKRLLKTEYQIKLKNDLKYLGTWTYKRIQNHYISVCGFNKDIPFLKNGYVHKKENDKLRNDWFRNIEEHVEFYPMFIDIDMKTFENFETARMQCYNLVKEIQKDLDTTCYVQFSGRGYHILIMAKVKDAKEVKRLTEIYKVTANNMKSTYYLIDTQVLQPNRLMKLPLSLSFYEEGCFLVTPLELNEILRYTLEDFKYKFYREENNEIIIDTDYLNERLNVYRKNWLKWERNEIIQNQLKTVQHKKILTE